MSSHEKIVRVHPQPPSPGVSSSWSSVNTVKQQLSSVAEMGDRLATVDMGRKVGDAVPLSVGS